MKPLPPPVEPQAADVPAQPQPESGGLFGLGSIFQSQQPSPEPDFLPASYHASSTGGSEPLSQEAERILGGVPKHIGDEPGEAQPGAPVSDAAAPGNVLPFPSAIIVTEENLATIFQLAFGWAADWRKRECYRLDDSKAGKLAGMWGEIVNRSIERFLPEFLARWSETNPGLLAALIGTLMIVGPMVQEDARQTAQESAQRRGVVLRDDQPQQQQEQHVPNVPPTRSTPGGAVQWAPGVAA